MDWINKTWSDNTWINKTWSDITRIYDQVREGLLSANMTVAPAFCHTIFPVGDEIK